MLKGICIGGRNLTYIENYNGSSSSVQGAVIEVNEDTREKVRDMGGFYGQLLSPLMKDDIESIKEFYILSLTLEGMEQITGISYYNGEEYKEFLTKVPNIAHYLICSLEEKELKLERVNTIEFLKGNQGIEFNRYLEEYYSPKAGNVTGLYLGEVMVNYGDKLEIKDISGLVKRFNMEDSSIGMLNPTKLTIEVSKNGMGIFGTIGRLIFERDGELITSIENYYLKEVMYEKEGIEDVDIEEIGKYIEKEKIVVVHDYAKSINKMVSGREDRKHLERQINYYNNRIEEEINSIYKPHEEMVSLDALLQFIKNGYVQKVK